MAKFDGEFNGEIVLTRDSKLQILRQARVILSDAAHWTTGKLRKIGPNDEVQYCLLGAIEQAAYDTGIFEPLHPFEVLYDENEDDSEEELGYRLADPISIAKYANEKHGVGPVTVNDGMGHAAVVELLDDYIKVVESEEE